MPEAVTKTASNSRKLTGWSSLVSAILGFGLLGWLLLQLDWQAMFTMLGRVNIGWFLLGALAYLINNLVRAYRFVRLAHLPLRRTMGMTHVVIAMSLANQILPLRLGELTYVYLARKSEDLSVGRGLTSLIVSRLFDFLAIGMLFVLVAAPTFSDLSSTNRIYFWASILIMVLVVVLIGGMVLFHGLITRFGQKLAQTTALQKLPGKQKIARVFVEIGQSLGQLGGFWQNVDLLISSLLVWLSSFGMLYILMISIDVPVTLAQTVVGATFAALTSILPINSFGNFGTLEVGWVAGFVMIGMDPSLALSSGFAIHLLALAYAVFFGVFSWVLILKKPGKQQEPNTK